MRTVRRTSTRWPKRPRARAMRLRCRRCRAKRWRTTTRCPPVLTEESAGGFAAPSRLRARRRRRAERVEARFDAVQLLAQGEQVGPRRLLVGGFFVAQLIDQPRRERSRHHTEQADAGNHEADAD